MNIELISSIKDAEEFCIQNFLDTSPFIRYYFFKLLEESNCTNKSTGWTPQHIVLKKNNSIVAFIPNFKKTNSYGEYIFDHVFENAYYQIGCEYFPKYLSGTPFTPVTRLKFIYSKKMVNFDQVINLLVDFLKKKNISSFHANFIDSEDSQKLEKHNFFKRLGIQYHWINKSYSDFSDFLSSMKSRKKKAIIKERTFLKEQGITFSIKKGNMITYEDLNILYKCYVNTIDKKWSRPYLNSEFFQGLINSQISNKMILICAYKQKRVLGCSVHFIGNNTLFGRYWGCFEEVPYLHFELCYYQAIEYAIKNKISRIEAGAQGEHKISRGYIPRLIYSNHWFNNKILNKPIKDFLIKENEKVIDTSQYLMKYSPFSEKRS